MAKVNLGRVKTVFREDWSTTTTDYVIDDIVLYRATAWLCKANAPTGEVPDANNSSYWTAYVPGTTGGIFGNSTYSKNIVTSNSIVLTAYMIGEGNDGNVVWSIPDLPAGWSTNEAGQGNITNSFSFSRSTEGTETFNVTATSGTLVQNKAITVNFVEMPYWANTSITLSLQDDGAHTFDGFVPLTYGSSAITVELASGSLPPSCTLSSNGELVFSAVSPEGSSTTYTFTLRATIGTNVVEQEMTFTSRRATPAGQQNYFTPGSYSWTAPTGVDSVNVVAVGAGSPGGNEWSGSGSGGGGGLGWKNNIPVTPGTSYTVCVGNSCGNCACPIHNNCGCSQGSYFINTSTVSGGGAGSLNGSYRNCGGNYSGDGGGCGGCANHQSWSEAAGGAGGYMGCGGSTAYNSGAPQCAGDGGHAGMGNYSSTWGQGGGGGVGMYGQNRSGACCGYNGTHNHKSCCTGYGGMGGNQCRGTGMNGQQGENACSYHNNCLGWSYYGHSCYIADCQPCLLQCNCNNNHMRTGGFPGGGSGSRGSSGSCCSAPGGNGALRIIWGSGRSYPCTLTDDVTCIG